MYPCGATPVGGVSASLSRSCDWSDIGQAMVQCVGTCLYGKSPAPASRLSISQSFFQASGSYDYATGKASFAFRATEKDWRGRHMDTCGCPPIVVSSPVPSVVEIGKLLLSLPYFVRSYCIVSSCLMEAFNRHMTFLSQSTNYRLSIDGWCD